MKWPAPLSQAGQGKETNMATILIKAAIILFLVVPLIFCVAWLGLSIVWLQVQDAKKAPAGDGAPSRGTF